MLSAIFIFTFLQNIIQTYTSESVAKDLRTQLSDKISRQSYAFVLKSNPSRLLTNLTSDIDSVKMFVSMAFVTIISSVFVIVGTSVLLILINWKLALDCYFNSSCHWRDFFYCLEESQSIIQAEQGKYRPA